MAKFDRHAMVNEADNPDITDGYANPEIAKPEEIVEEPQEAGEVRTGSDFNVIVTGDRNEDIGEDVFHCVYYCSPQFYCLFLGPLLSPEIFHFCFRALQQPKFLAFEPMSS